MLCLFLVNKIQSNDIGDWPLVSKHTPPQNKVRDEIYLQYNVHYKKKRNSYLAFMGICLVIISEWPPLSHKLLWFWCTEF